MKHAILATAIALTVSIGQVSGETVQSLLDRLGTSDNRQTTAELQNNIWKGWIGDYADDAQKDLMAKGIKELEARELQSAEQTFSDLITLNPGFTEAWNKRATVRYLLDDLDGSEADVAEVLSREPRHFGAISGLALISLQRGDLESAIRAYEDLLKVDPLNQNALRLLPELKRKLGISDI